LTAQALDLEGADRDRSRSLVMAALKLAPTLIPAATLAAKYFSEHGEVRRAMRAIESAWRAQPHPDLADAYVHVRLGDSARERLARAVTLASRTPGERQGALALARAAIDATEFAQARAALAPFIAAPTQRVAMLMAELERTENGDEARAREWTVRAVRAAHDPAWTADGYVSDRWRPVSPVTGRLDAFQWIVPVAALPGIVPAETLSPPVPSVAPPIAPVETSRDVPRSLAEPAPVVPLRPASQPETPPAVFRPRPDLDRLKPAAPIPPVVALTHPPDDPGIEGEGEAELDDDADSRAQAGGWQGFLSRMRR
jgi:HemY protein